MSYLTVKLLLVAMLDSLCSSPEHEGIPNRMLWSIFFVKKHLKKKTYENESATIPLSRFFIQLLTMAHLNSRLSALDEKLAMKCCASFFGTKSGSFTKSFSPWNGPTGPISDMKYESKLKALLKKKPLNNWQYSQRNIKCYIDIIQYTSVHLWYPEKWDPFFHRSNINQDIPLRVSLRGRADCVSVPSFLAKICRWDSLYKSNTIADLKTH